MHLHSLFNLFRDFLPATVSLETRELLDVFDATLPIGESDGSLFTDEPEWLVPFLSSSRSAAAISGNINSVLDDFLDDVGNLEADLHLAPFA